LVMTWIEKIQVNSFGGSTIVKCKKTNFLPSLSKGKN
jgi:hypothetical protein